MYTKTLELKKPVTLGSVTTTVVQFRPVKVKDMRKLGVNPATDPVDWMLTLASKISDADAAVFEEIEGEDLGAVLEIVGEFIPAGLTTGS